ncbi:MAG TPA: 16S rRNA (guanine(527)-N(7))-methyltransferase RsmG [Anaerolineae bacterium]|nr:16S rRNA (guanine(527)-N(7))-methyltransferase RsmG [Anaerolineae bacterium]
MTPAKIDLALLASGAREFDLDLSPAQLDQFARYAELLIDWNLRFNLTSIADPRDIVIKHFLDSLSAARSIPAGPIKLMDVGAGAGLPGLPLKIARPEITLTLVEATRKKCDFLKAVADDLHLSAVQVVNARAEDAGRMEDHREQYDIAIARAVADLPVLIEYLLPFVKIGGFAVAQKSREAADELDRADTAILLLGGLGSEIINVKVPGLNDERTLILIEKITATSDEYPRRTGVPAKKPLL